jgi:DNA-binding response OmpR family regulator
MMNRTVLVIDKDESIREIVSIILTEQGFTVRALENELNALQMILEVMPCAIILDIIKVTEDGTELCRLIKQHELIREIPVIILSTHPKAASVKEICADEVVPKPFDIDQLIEALKNQLI